MNVLERIRFLDICKKLYMQKAEWPSAYPHEGEAGEVWEQVCAEVLLLHGPPPPHPGFGPQYDMNGVLRNAKERKAAYIKRVEYITGIENTLAQRYKLHPGLMGPFIAGFELWCTIQVDKKEEESCVSS